MLNRRVGELHSDVTSGLSAAGIQLGADSLPTFAEPSLGLEAVLRALASHLGEEGDGPSDHGRRTARRRDQRVESSGHRCAGRDTDQSASRGVRRGRPANARGHVASGHQRHLLAAMRPTRDRAAWSRRSVDRPVGGRETTRRPHGPGRAQPRRGRVAGLSVHGAIDRVPRLGGCGGPDYGRDTRRCARRRSR